MSFVLLAFVTAGAVFAQAPTLDKLKFTSMANNTVVSAANDKISGAVVIPDTYNGNPVVQINYSAFRNNTGITSVTIPASVSMVGTAAFNGCTSLTSVTILGKNVKIMNIPDSFPGDLDAKYKAGGPGTYTRQAGSTVWTKQAAVANTSLEGSWRLQANGSILLSISGSTATFSDFAGNIPVPVWQDAINKGIIKTGGQYLRNLRSTGNLTWSGQYLEVTWNDSNRNVATGTRWTNGTLTMSPDGSTITDGSGASWIRAGIQ